MQQQITRGLDNLYLGPDHTVDMSINLGGGSRLRRIGAEEFFKERKAEHAAKAQATRPRSKGLRKRFRKRTTDKGSATREKPSKQVIGALTPSRRRSHSAMEEFHRLKGALKKPSTLGAEDPESLRYAKLVQERAPQRNSLYQCTLCLENAASLSTSRKPKKDPIVFQSQNFHAHVGLIHYEQATERQRYFAAKKLFSHDVPPASPDSHSGRLYEKLKQDLLADKPAPPKSKKQKPKDKEKVTDSDSGSESDASTASSAPSPMKRRGVASTFVKEAPIPPSTLIDAAPTVPRALRSGPLTFSGPGFRTPPPRPETPLKPISSDVAALVMTPTSKFDFNPELVELVEPPHVSPSGFPSQITGGGSFAVALEPPTTPPTVTHNPFRTDISIDPDPKFSDSWRTARAPEPSASGALGIVPAMEAPGSIDNTVPSHFNVDEYLEELRGDNFLTNLGSNDRRL